MLTVMTTRIGTLEQVRAFLEGTAQVEFEIPGGRERRAWIEAALVELGYVGLGKPARGLVIRYLRRISGYSRQQITRLIAQYRQTGRVEDRRKAPAKPFATRYTAEDAALLAEVDRWHGTLSGPATKKLCERAWKRFRDARFKRLAGISVSHLYNLRRSKAYVRKRGKVEKTRPVKVNIGQRRVPRPEGRPGFLRVDSVHSGDWDGAKGLYVINAVDEVTQYQFMAAVPRLGERDLVPALKGLLDAFPFKILGFHADNGSEYVNHQVAEMLNKLLIEFTKSRPRRSNDNALVESKNGSVVRKHLGYAHIPARGAEALNVHLRGHLWPYLNYHRPCFFPVTEIDAKGRQRKRYPYENLMTPYDKFRSLPNGRQYLKPGITWKALAELASAVSDHEAARRMSDSRDRLFRSLNRGSKAA
jgi:transposase InsO family protein